MSKQTSEAPSTYVAILNFLNHSASAFVLIAAQGVFTELCYSSDRGNFVRPSVHPSPPSGLTGLKPGLMGLKPGL